LSASRLGRGRKALLLLLSFAMSGAYFVSSIGHSLPFFRYNTQPAQYFGQTETGPASPQTSLPVSLDDKLRQAGLKRGDPVFIRIFKKEYLLELWMRQAGENKFKLFARYPVCAMSGKLGPKIVQGDNQAPEGFYAVGLRHFNPHSRYHLSFNIGYPNAYDRSHGRTGDFIMVHGNCVSAGCFAMTDPYIEEIYGLAEAALKQGQPFFRVHIFPFRLTEENLAPHALSPWLEFWQMLKPGYDFFEQHKIPPDMIVRDKAYQFSGESAP
jgi:murein L,D-transpeptidase YafK